MNQDLRWFLSFRFFTTVAMQMKMTILGYYLYEITDDVYSLGLLGLYEAIPRVGMALPAGYIVERMDKKRAVIAIILGYFILSLILFATLFFWPDHHQLPYMIYAIVFLMGIIGSMGGAASVSLFSLIIPREKTAELSAINSNSWMVGATVGPILGGFLIAQVGPVFASLGICITLLIGFLSVLNLPSKKPEFVPPFQLEDSILKIKEGIHFVFQNKVMLWAISLDLFAVLFGGCVALLPVFAKDILKTDSTGFGILRAAMTIGSFLSMLFLSRYPLKKNTGNWLLIAVFLFGLSNIGFALSTSFWLSFFFLFTAGAFDAISVVVRGTLLILETPEHMRARVSSVNSMFISSSNEIGAFESGFAAEILGTVRSVVFGGLMTILFVVLAYKKGQTLKNYTIEKS